MMMKPTPADRIMYWLPRVLSIIFILFLSVFALDTPFPGFLMHLLPSLSVVAVLLIAWKRECFGSWLFVMLGGAFMMFFKTYESISMFLMLSMPLFMIGILFLYDCVMFDDPIRKKAKGLHKRK